MDNEVKINITPAMNESEFNKVKKQIEQLQKLAATSTDNNLKSGINKVTNTSSKAEKAWQAGDLKNYNKAIIEIYKNFIELTSQISAGSTDLGKSLQKLSKVFIEKSKELENATKNLARKQTAFKGNAEIAAYKNLAENYKIGFTGKGNRQGYVKSEGGLIQTLVANQLSGKQSISDFNKAQGLNTNLDENVSIQKQAEQVAKAFTNKLVKEYEAQLKDQAKTIENLTEAIKSNIAKQNKAIEALKISNPQDAPVLNGLQSTIGGAENFSAEQANKGATEGSVEGAIEASQDLKNAQDQLATSNLKVEKSFKGSILGATVYGLAIRQLRKWISQAVKTITEIDQALTTQAMVSGKTRKETYALVGAYQDLAKQCGATTTEVAKVATAYFRQGKSVEEAMTLTKTAVTAAKVAGISTTESVDYLTTAVNGFQLAAKDAMQVSDRFAALAASAAVSYDELAIALSKVASQANLAGMSMDYTLALLTKGIETTRESAESIGTALKTVLARMREISDYGETLEDGININNVEMQLSYVNIALRNSSGELRSTEEVLDELGKKWETLSSNQQASIAKALAGTRQQSRLIAMMSNYQRTTELAVIAQQSLGATEAQAAEYLQGMEAATNKLTTAYQSLITSVTDSEIIIGIVNTLSGVLDHLAEFLSTDSGMITAIILISGIATNLLFNVIEQKRELIEINRLKELESLYAKKKQLLEKISLKDAQKQAALEKIRTDIVNTQNKMLVIQGKLEVARQRAARGDISALDEINTLEAERITTARELEQQNIDLNNIISSTVDESEELNTIEEQIKEKSSSIPSFWDALKDKIGGVVNTFVPFVSLLKLVPGLLIQSIMKTKQLTAEQAKALVIEKLRAGWAAFTRAVKDYPIIGIAIGAALLAAIAGIGIAVHKAQQKTNDKKEVEEARESVQGLTQDLYNLNKSAQTIDTIATKFENLSKKIIKTTEDLEELENLYQQLKEEGFTEEQIANIKNASPEYAKQIIEDVAEQKRSTAAVVAQNKINKAKSWVDKAGTEDKAEATAAYNDAILQGWKQDIQRQAKQFSSENQQLINSFLANVNSDSLSVNVGTDLVNSLDSTELWGKKINGTIGKKSWKSRLSGYDSFKDAEDSVYNTIRDAVKNKDFASLSKTLSDQQLTDLMNNMGVKDASVFGNKTKDFVANLTDSRFSEMKTIGDTSSSDWSSYINNWNSFKDYAAQNGIALEKMYPQIAATIQMIGDSPELMNSGWTVQQFSDLTELGANKQDLVALAAWAESSYDPDKIPDRLKNNSELLSKMGNVIFKEATSTQADINNYKKNRGAAIEQMEKFLSGEATTSELRTALEDAGVNSAEALEAAMQGDYQKVYKAIETANAERDAELKQTLEDKERYYEALLEIETDPNKADEYRKSILEIQQQIKEIDDLNKTSVQAIYKAIQQEKEYQDKKIAIVKEALQKEADLRKKQLEDLKTAYQNYFDEIDKEQESIDYEENRARIINNIGALGASTDAASMQALAELEKQLTELDKEREETLRQAGRDALLSNVDDQVKKIEEDLNAILENNQKLLERISDDKKLTHYGLTALSNSINSGENTTFDILTNWNNIASDLGIDTSGLNNILSSGFSSEVTSIETKNSNTFLLTLADGTTTELSIDGDEENTFMKILTGVLQKNGYAGTNK